MTRLSEIGELGLLAELERRGLIVGVEHDAAQLAAASSSRRTRSSRASTSASTGSAGASSASAPRPSTSATSPPRAPSPEALARDARAARRRRRRGRGRALRGDRRDRCAGRRRRHDRVADAVMLSVTALGRSERVPGRAGAQPGDVLVVTGPLGARGRRVPRAALRPAAAAARRRARRSRGRAHALLDLSDGLAVDAGHIARRSGVRCVLELDARAARAGATVDDLGFGEDFELLAAVADAGRFAGGRPGRGGEGVELLLRRRAVRARRLGALRARSRARTSSAKCFFDRAPTTVSRGSPSANRITVGIESTPKRSAVRGFASMSSLRTRRARSRCELVERRLDRLARPAPRRPEVDDDRLRRRCSTSARTSRR